MICTWSWQIKPSPLRQLLSIPPKQCWSHTGHPLAKAEPLTRCFNSILMSVFAQWGTEVGRHGINHSTFLFHFKTFHKGSKNMPPTTKKNNISKLIPLWLQNVYSCRQMFISLPSIFCVRASRLNFSRRLTCQMLLDKILQGSRAVKRNDDY